MEEGRVTARQAYAKAGQALHRAGLTREAAGREARELLAFCWEREGLALLLDFDASLPDAVLERYEAMVQCRCTGKPMAYLIKSEFFRGRPLQVWEGVLIPRADTEILVEQALARLPEGEPARLLELGCGSGAVLAAIAAERPLLRGEGVDINPLAVALTEKNLAAWGVSARVTVKCGSWFLAVSPEEKWTMIVSNPPYISTEEMEALPKEVKREPWEALWGGEDGLDHYKLLVPEAATRLTPGGWCLMEIGWRQGPAVEELFHAAGLAEVTVHRDLGQRDRVVAGQKR